MMTTIVNQDRKPGWRNFAAWSGMGAIFYVLAVWAGTTLLNEGGAGALLRAMLHSSELAAMLGLGMILSMSVTGFSSRKRPFNRRNLRNFVIRDVAAIAACLLAIWGFSTAAEAGALEGMGASAWAAAVTGAALIVVALLGALSVASAHTGGPLVDDEEVAEEMRDRGRLILFSLVWMGACGLLLIGLSLAGPGGVLSRRQPWRARWC